MNAQHSSMPARAARGGASVLLIVVMMVVGSLVLWVGVPAGWLWIGSQIQAETNNVGLAIFAMLFGSATSIVVLAMLLVRLNRLQEHLREASGKPPRETPLLEMVLVVTAGIAVVAFGFWFFILTGPGPSLAPSN